MFETGKLRLMKLVMTIIT